MKQLDLFHSNGIVIPFPPARRVDLVNQAVEALLTRNREDGRKFWNRHRERLMKDLASLKLPPSEIEQLLSDYTRTVRNQMQIRISTAKAR